MGVVWGRPVLEPKSMFDPFIPQSLYFPRFLKVFFAFFLLFFCLGQESFANFFNGREESSMPRGILASPVRDVDYYDLFKEEWEQRDPSEDPSLKGLPLWFLEEIRQERAEEVERKRKGLPGHVTCVDKANVFKSMAFFRKIFEERAVQFQDIDIGFNYVDAQALDFVRKPWAFDVLVTENMFGDILSDLAGGLVGGMGMAACGEIGDEHGLFQPAHGSAPDIMGQDKANPLAAILSGALMLDYLADKSGLDALSDAADLIDQAVEKGFEQNRLRPMEFGGDMGTREVTEEVIHLIKHHR